MTCHRRPRPRGRGGAAPGRGGALPGRPPGRPGDGRAPLPPLGRDPPLLLLGRGEERRRRAHRVARRRSRAEGLRAAPRVRPGPGAPPGQPLGLGARGRGRQGRDDDGPDEPLRGRLAGPGQGRAAGQGPLPLQAQPRARRRRRRPRRGDDALRAAGLHLPPARRAAALRGRGKRDSGRENGPAAPGDPSGPALRPGRPRRRGSGGGPYSGKRGPPPAPGAVHVQRRASTTWS